MDTAPIKCPYAGRITHLCQKIFQSHEEAAIHLILDHNARPILLNENGQFICLYAKDFGRSGCQETFPTQKATTEHLELAHQNETEPIQCPISSKCKINCYTLGGLKQHVQNSHRVAAFRCTWKNCSKTYTCRSGLYGHIESDHKGKKWHCPVKGCKKEYNSEAGRRGHMKVKHPNWQDASKPQPSKRRRGKSNVPQTSEQPAQSVELKCPFSYCNKKSHNRDALKWHLYVKQHKGEPIPCQVEGCRQSFLDLRSWEQHTKDHKNPPVEYHACRAEACPMTFKTEEKAQAHYQKQHIDLGYGRICPTCNETFSSNDARRMHELKHTLTFVCSRLHCNQRFKTCEMAIEHSSGVDHDFVGKLYTCPVPNCAVTAAGRGLTKDKLEYHFGRHVRLDNVPEGIELVPILAPVPQPLPRLPLFEAIYAHNAYLSLEQDTSPGQDEEKASKTEDMGLADDDLMGVDYDALDQYNLDLSDDMPLEAEDDLGPIEDDDEELFSEKHRSHILEQNAEFWQNHKDQPINLHGRGRICCGPGLATGDFVLEPCPGRVVIDLDTARLRLGGPKNGTRTITLNYVCVSCFTMKRARAFLEQGQAKSDNSLERVDLKVLRDLFADAAEKEWTCPPEFQKILERIKDIEEGNMPPCSLLIVDTEFSLATRQPWEVAIIEYLSGETRLNALLDHSHGLSHESENRRIVQISKMHAKNVYNTKRNLVKLNVHQVAKALKEIGIDSDTLFVIWAIYPLDLQILRNYLVAGGYSGILPDDEHCIPVCQTFRQNLYRIRPGKQFPLRLEIIFPVFHPGHRLIGANHEALPDCQQTRHMCLAVPELRKPVKNREKQWRPEYIKKPSAGSIHNYFPVIKQEQQSDDVLDESKEKNKSAGKPLKPPMRQAKLPFARRVQSEPQEAAPSEVGKPVRRSKRLGLTHK